MMQVIFTCFAGRERYMKVLIPYIERLSVDEVHIWDYTRNENDAQYLRRACTKFQGYDEARHLEKYTLLALEKKK